MRIILICLQPGGARADFLIPKRSKKQLDICGFLCDNACMLNKELKKLSREETNAATRALMAETMQIARTARLTESQKLAQVKREISRERRINKPLNLWS